MSKLGSSLSVKLEPGSLFLSIAGTVGKPCIAAVRCCIHDWFVYFPTWRDSTKYLLYIFLSTQPYKSKARDFVKLYSFLSILIPMRDKGLEKLFVFLRFLLPKLPAEKGTLPTEVQGMVNMEKLAVRKNAQQDIGLKRGLTPVELPAFGAGAGLTEAEQEALSKILEDLNTRFNTSFTPDEIIVLKQLEKKINEDEMLQQQLQNSSRPGLKATFEQVARDAFEDIFNENKKFYVKVSNDQEVAKELFSKMFEWYCEGHKLQTPPSKE